VAIKFFNFFFIVTLIWISQGCNENNNDVQMHNDANTDVKQLRKFIQLPKEPVTVKWQSGDVVATSDQSVPGPKDWGLVAVLEFKPNDISELIVLSNVKEQSRAASLPENFMWDWVEQVLDAKSKKINNFYKIDGAARNADIFVRTPLLNGYWVEFKENTILLYLYTR